MERHLNDQPLTYEVWPSWDAAASPVFTGTFEECRRWVRAQGLALQPPKKYKWKYWAFHIQPRKRRDCRD